MMDVLLALESSRFATWVRESPSVFAYPLFLTLHTIGLGLLVGTTAGIALRVLGVAPALPVGPLVGFFRVAWLGFWINALSGVVLLVASVTAFLAHPAFYLKLAAIALAVATLPTFERQLRADATRSGPLTRRAKRLAAMLLAWWTVAITAGRVTSYGGAVGLMTGVAVLVAGALLVAGCYAMVWRRPSSVRRAA